MSDLASFSVLNTLVEQTKDSLALPNHGIAFDQVALELLFHLNQEEIEESLTDGGDDGGIDAVYIIGHEIHILSMKYTKDFEKTSANFPGVAIDSLITTTKEIISGNLVKESVNTALFDKYIEIKELAKSGTIKFHTHIVSNKEHPVKIAKTRLESALSQFRLITFNYYNLDQLVTKILENQIQKIDGSLTLLNTLHFEKSDANIKTIIGVIAATDLIKLITSPDSDEIREEIFNQNIRTYKPKHTVNKNIIESALAENNYQFFYLNNGITILCESAVYLPHTRNPILEMKNLQIINGGQTSHSLFYAYKKNQEKINNIDLLVRVCIADPEDEISARISESTNKQIPVSNRDLHSNDLIQIKLAKEFDTLGYYYERKAGQYRDKPKDKVLNNEILGQLYMSFYLERPSEAKNNKSQIFGEIYEDIFNDEEINARTLLSLYELYKPILEMKKEIQSKKRRKEPINEKEAFISRASFHILFGMKLIQEFDGIKLETALIQKEIRNKTIDYIYEIVEDEMEKRKDGYTNDKFFKEVSTNRLIRSHIAQKYEVEKEAKEYY